MKKNRTEIIMTLKRVAIVLIVLFLALYGFIDIIIRILKAIF